MFARKNEDSKIDEEVRALRSANALTFIKPSNVALIDRRVLKSYNFSSNVYELGSTLQLICNSGADAVWGPSSYLRFEYTASALLDFGSGSVLNCIKSIRLTHRSGEILEYIDNVNILANLRLYWEHSTDDFKKLTGMLGFESPTVPYRNKPGLGVNVACIPLSLISGLFSNTSQYMPPALIAGMKIELELAPNSFITILGKAAPQITNIKPTLLLDSAQLYDVVSKQLLMEMADVDQSGIQFSYETFFNSYVVTNTNAINLDVQQSASLTSQIIGITRDNNQVTTLLDDGDANSYIVPYTVSGFRLGSLYLPQQQIKVPTGITWDITERNSKEWYGIGLMGFQSYVDEFHKAAGKAASIKFTEANAVPEITNQSFTTGKACLSFSLEKSSCGLEMTGEPTNNSRILNFSGVVDVLNGQGTFPLSGTVTLGNKYTLTEIRFDSFLRYVRVANCMGDNCVVDR